MTRPSPRKPQSTTGSDTTGQDSGGSGAVISDVDERFVTLVTEHQRPLLAYVFSLVGDHHRAADVLQEVNLTLWRKRSHYDPRRPFLPWVFAIARLQVLANLRDRKRDRVLLDQKSVAAIAAEAETQVGRMEASQSALRVCLQRLSPEQRRLIDQRYFGSCSIRELSDSQGRTVAAVKVALLRTRRQLADCIRRQLGTT